MDLSVNNPKVVQTEKIPYVYNIILTETSRPCPGPQVLYWRVWGEGCGRGRGRGHARLGCALAAPYCTRNKLGHGRGELGFRGERNEGERQRAGQGARSLCLATDPSSSAGLGALGEWPWSTALFRPLDWAWAHCPMAECEARVTRVLAPVPRDGLQTPKGNFIYFSV